MTIALALDFSQHVPRVTSEVEAFSMTRMSTPLLDQVSLGRQALWTTLVLFSNSLFPIRGLLHPSLVLGPDSYRGWGFLGFLPWAKVFRVDSGPLTHNICVCVFIFWLIQNLWVSYLYFWVWLTSSIFF